jgi:hypothetical protein
MGSIIQTIKLIQFLISAVLVLTTVVYQKMVSLRTNVQTLLFE